MSRTAARIALLSALAGLLASGTAAYVHYQLLSDPGYLSFCDVSATVNCTEVYSSRYGSLGGVSVAVFGAIWFAFATLLAGAGLTAPPSVRENVPGYLFAGSTLALAVVLYLGYASFVILKLVCILCVITYAGVVTLFLVSGATATAPMWSLPRRAAHDLKALATSPLAFALTALVAGTSAFTLAVFPREVGPAVPSDAATAAAIDKARASEFERWYTAQPRREITVASDGAKVLVVKFNDYQCPACGGAYQEYKSVFAKYESSQPGAVRRVVMDFPLEAECNSSVATSLHAASCEAAVAVRLARARNLAGALEEWLFANQSRMTRGLVRKWAQEIGQVPDFDARYASTLEAVKADIAYSQQLGVNSTPTFFINGVKVEGALPVAYFDQAIAYELQRAK